MKQVQCNTKVLAVLMLLFTLEAVVSCGGCNGGSAAPPPPPAIAVGITPSGSQSVDQGQSIKFTANVSNDSSNKGVVWSLTQNGSSCSPGCGTISPASTASGAPATYTAPAAVNANLQFSVTATSVADTTKSASDQTTAVPPPTLNNPATLPAATVSQAYSYQLTESGGVSPFTWSITSGSLPAGLTLNSSTGLISGTPTAAVAVGAKATSTAQPFITTTSNITVQVIDSGTPQLKASQALAFAVSGKASTTTVLASSANPSASGQSVTFTATVSSTSPGTPTGTVTFLDGATSLGTGALNASAQATFSTTALALGAHSITAQYGGDGNFTSSTSSVLSQVVNATPDFSLSASPSSLTLAPGTSGTATITVSPVNGFNGSVSLSVTSGVVAPLAGSFSPVNTTTTSVFTLTVGSNAGGAGAGTITITGTSGGLTHTVTVSFTISQKAFAFARASLPDGKIGTAYNQLITTFNGTGSVKITKVSGTFPPGLGLTTTTSATDVQGTPQGPNGTYIFTLQAQDSSAPAQTIQITYVISITPIGACVFDVSGAGPPNGNTGLKGTYVYRFQGFDVNGKAIARLGIFTADGNQARDATQSFGHITALTEESMSSANGYTPPAALANSTYCIDPTTNITQITLGSVMYQAAIIGNVLGTSDGISFIEFDPGDKVRGSGVMRLQQASAIAQPAAGTVSYVFGMSGRDDSSAISPNAPVAVVGTFSLDTALASATGLSGNTGEEDFDDQAANGLMVPTVNYPGITVKLTSSNLLSTTGRYTGALTSSPAAGDINFSAYVITAASGVLPTANSPTLFFAISTGTPNKTVLSGEIVSQNFATQTTFANSKTPGTPDARALTTPSSMFYISGLDPKTAPGVSETSAAALGFIGFDGNRGFAGPSGKIVDFELDIDVGGAVQGPVTATNPPGATYTVAADGRTTFNGGSIPGLAYLCDLDTGFVLDAGGTIATAGFGQLLVARVPGAGFPPVFGNFALVGDVAASVLDSATTAGTVMPVTGGLNWTLDVDSPFSGLTPNFTSPSPLPVKNTDTFGRFTVGACPPPTGGLPGVCLVGYDSGQFGPNGGGVLVMDETNTGPKFLPQWPSINIWGVVP